MENFISYLVFVWRNSIMEFWRAMRVQLGDDEGACLYQDLLEMIDDGCFPSDHILKTIARFRVVNKDKWRIESLFNMMKDRRPTLLMEFNSKLNPIN